MRAVVADQSGAPDVLHPVTLPDPEPGSGQVRVVVELPEATALLAGGRTAASLHRAANIQPGETVVITAAAGGVGSILVQLAKASGAQVVALAGSAAKLNHARSLGADTTVSYRDHDWTTRLHTAVPDGVDVVFDGIGADTTAALFGVVRPNITHADQIFVLAHGTVIETGTHHELIASDGLYQQLSTLQAAGYRSGSS